MSYQRSTSLDVIPATTESRSLPIYTRPKPSLFALLIGINDYGHVRALRGAVPDVLSVKVYLESYLRVPEDQIQSLLNKSASRAAIIEAFIQLRNDERINEGDPILIYFAGHGSELPGPEGGPGKRTQAIVPQDYCEEYGKQVLAIPDHTIGALVAKIAEKKGDNITLIFDCCHSASGTRGTKGDDAWSPTAIRSVEIDPSIHTENLDRDIWASGRRATSTPSNLLRGNLSSHMLIASCSSSESAIEINGHGSFSSSFLKLLRSTPPDELRYADILPLMDAIPHQNPQCEGLNQKRYLFNSQVSMHAKTIFNITHQQGKFVLDAGLVAGVSEGAQFTAHAYTDKLFKNPLGTLVVDILRPFSTELKLLPGTFPFTLGQSSVALQTKTGYKKDLQIYVPGNDAFAVCRLALMVLMEREHEFQSIDLVDKPEYADFSLAMENQKIVFLYWDERVIRHGHTRLYESVTPTPEELAPVLRSAVHFYWKLNRTNNNSEVNKNVQIELYQLLPPKIHRVNEVGGGLVPTGPNLYQGGVMNVVADTDLNLPYGFKITNNTPYDLYPHLFYFDLSDLSIVPYYEPSSTAKRYTLDVPLPKNGGTLTIGYGTGGAPAQTFYLRTGQKLDVGFLKIFLSTVPVDLSTIPQSSPFERTRSAEQLTKTEEEVWGTMLIPVLQHPSDPLSFQEVQNMLHTQAMQKENYALRQELDIKYKKESALKEELHREQVTRKHVENLLAIERGKTDQPQTSNDPQLIELLSEIKQPSSEGWLERFLWSYWRSAGSVS